MQMHYNKILQTSLVRVMALVILLLTLFATSCDTHSELFFLLPVPRVLILQSSVFSPLVSPTSRIYECFRPPCLLSNKRFGLYLPCPFRLSHHASCYHIQYRLSHCRRLCWDLRYLIRSRLSAPWTSTRIHPFLRHISLSSFAAHRRLLHRRLHSRLWRVIWQVWQ